MNINTKLTNKQKAEIYLSWCNPLQLKPCRIEHLADEDSDCKLRLKNAVTNLMIFLSPAYLQGKTLTKKLASAFDAVEEAKKYSFLRVKYVWCGIGKPGRFEVIKKD